MTAKLFNTIKIKRIKHHKGNIIKFIDRKKKYFKGFGELYFSEIKKGKFKGWNYHKKNICLLRVSSGKVKFFFKKNIKSKKIYKFNLSDKMDQVIQIKPKTWFAFTSKTKISLITNFMKNVHNNKETLKDLIINPKKIK